MVDADMMCTGFWFGFLVFGFLCMLNSKGGGEVINSGEGPKTTCTCRIAKENT